MLLIHIAGHADIVRTLPFFGRAHGGRTVIMGVCTYSAEDVVGPDMPADADFDTYTADWAVRMDKRMDEIIKLHQCSGTRVLVFVGSMYRSAPGKVYIYSPRADYACYVSVSGPALLEAVYKQALREADWASLAEGKTRIPSSAQLIRDEDALLSWYSTNKYEILPPDQVNRQVGNRVNIQ